MTSRPARLALMLFAAAFCLPAGAAAQDRQNKEIETVKQRLKVMRFAVEAFVEADNTKAAELVERAMHARELAIKGVRTEEAAKVRKAAPNRGQLARHLAAAAKLCKSAGRPDRASALGKLSEVYSQQWRRQQRVQQQVRGGERKQGQQPRRRTLDSLERRVVFLEIAREAYAEAGQKRNERALAASVRYGKLSLGNAKPDVLARAAQGVPAIGDTIKLLQGAHKLLAKNGQKERAMACNNLAEYYVKRERDRRRTPAANQEPARPRNNNLEQRENRIEVLRLARKAHTENQDRKASAQLERVLHLAELQLEGANDKALTKAMEGLSQGMITELVQGAAELYHKWGKPDRADQCRRLAQFYRNRTEGTGGAGEQRKGAERQWSSQQELVRELQARVERMHRELDEIQELLRRLSK